MTATSFVGAAAKKNGGSTFVCAATRASVLVDVSSLQYHRSSSTTTTTSVQCEHFAAYVREHLHPKHAPPCLLQRRLTLGALRSLCSLARLRRCTGILPGLSSQSRLLLGVGSCGGVPGVVQRLGTVVIYVVTTMGGLHYTWGHPPRPL